MIHNKQEFDLDYTLNHVRHFLPSQAPLKDFIHHNTLHAFQEKKFHEALSNASEIFGYKVYLTLEEYRELYRQHKIEEKVLQQLVAKKQKHFPQIDWMEMLIKGEFEEDTNSRIGRLRGVWKKSCKTDLDSLVHPILFRILGSYLDQGISIWNFPAGNKTFIESIRELDKNSLISIFRSSKARKLLQDESIGVLDLLQFVVGKPEYYENYLTDQQFAHPGWSGLVSVIEENPNTLIDKKNISLKDLVHLELLLEIDALESHLGKDWKALTQLVFQQPIDLFAAVEENTYRQVIQLWQDAFEWSYYDAVLSGIKHAADSAKTQEEQASFQAIFCIDDRECSLRRHLESFDKQVQTFGTAGHFNIEFYFQPEHSKFHTKVCPAPMTPGFLIREMENSAKQRKDAHFHQRTHGLLLGWIFTHTLGFWSAIKLAINIFVPSQNAASVSSSKHMDVNSVLTITNTNGEVSEEGLQIGFTHVQMADRVEGLLRGIGLVKNFANLVYAIGHGSSSVNNTHYAGYDCGACSGRPGSVNARVLSFMANAPEVRAILSERGIHIPDTTRFVGALHDTSRDEITFFDVRELNEAQAAEHIVNEQTFLKTLDMNAKERSRRFLSINTHLKASSIHQKVKTRTVSLFEPRPELNHATNALCVVGRRTLSKGVFLDRRAFLNSYDYSTDPSGNYLLPILNAVAPVCGGINLEYYFSRVDNHQLGAGTKLPHNVMGLIAVANGIDGDLRTGLPSQMIEVHDPLRLLVIVEHLPEVVFEVIQRNPATYEWFKNEWVRLVIFHPEEKSFYVFENQEIKPYNPLTLEADIYKDPLKEMETALESSIDNLPVYLLKS